MDALRELYRPDIPIWSLVVRAIVVYVGVLALPRIAGKKQVASLGMSEFVALLLISNAVQNSMNGGDNSLIGGVILAITLILMSWAFQYASFKSRKLEQIVQGRPTLLIHKGKVLINHLNREMMTLRELKTILRKQGVHDIHEVCDAILESDGYVSITKMSDVQPEIEMERNDYY